MRQRAGGRAGGGERPGLYPAAAGRPGGRFLSGGGRRSRVASGERRPRAEGRGRRVVWRPRGGGWLAVTAAVTQRAGKDPVGTGSRVSLAVRNGGAEAPGASVPSGSPGSR